jgi:hypothetical protein
MRQWFRGVMASTLLLAGTASAGDVFLVIWSGGKTRAEGEKGVRELQGPPWSGLLHPQRGLPQRL